MLTTPRIVERPVTPYAAVAREVTIPFGDDIGPAMSDVAGYLDGAGVADFGPALFKYNLIDMPRLEVEFGFQTPKLLAPKDGLVVAELPAGTYASLLYTGHYDNLMEVNAVLIGWAAHKGIAWDVEATAEGDRFGCRVETYFDPPVGDPETWRTEVAIRVRG